mmetsp:Transcript_2780/g.17292  ORF Transcript_2780/g.17292 Transcript_2780/m.17292 type:complete len:211 (+) Transcript_2780:913-1545(+)
MGTLGRHSYGQSGKLQVANLCSVRRAISASGKVFEQSSHPSRSGAWQQWQLLRGWHRFCFRSHGKARLGSYTPNRQSIPLSWETWQQHQDCSRVCPCLLLQCFLRNSVGQEPLNSLRMLWCLVDGFSLPSLSGQTTGAWPRAPIYLVPWLREVLHYTYLKKQPNFHCLNLQRRWFTSAWTKTNGPREKLPLMLWVHNLGSLVVVFFSRVC